MSKIIYNLIFIIVIVIVVVEIQKFYLQNTNSIDYSIKNTKEIFNINYNDNDKDNDNSKVRETKSKVNKMSSSSQSSSKLKRLLKLSKSLYTNNKVIRNSIKNISNKSSTIPNQINITLYHSTSPIKIKKFSITVFLKPLIKKLKREHPILPPPLPIICNNNYCNAVNNISIQSNTILQSITISNSAITLINSVTTCYINSLQFSPEKPIMSWSYYGTNIENINCYKYGVAVSQCSCIYHTLLKKEVSLQLSCCSNITSIPSSSSSSIPQTISTSILINNNQNLILSANLTCNIFQSCNTDFCYSNSYNSITDKSLNNTKLISISVSEKFYSNIICTITASNINGILMYFTYNNINSNITNIINSINNNEDYNYYNSIDISNTKQNFKSNKKSLSAISYLQILSCGEHGLFNSSSNYCKYTKPLHIYSYTVFNTICCSNSTETTFNDSISVNLDLLTAINNITNNPIINNNTQFFINFLCPLPNIICNDQYCGFSNTYYIANSYDFIYYITPQQEFYPYVTCFTTINTPKVQLLMSWIYDKNGMKYISYCGIGENTLISCDYTNIGLSIGSPIEILLACCSNFTTISNSLIPNILNVNYLFNQQQFKTNNSLICPPQLVCNKQYCYSINNYSTSDSDGMLSFIILPDDTFQYGVNCAINYYNKNNDITTLLMEWKYDINNLVANITCKGGYQIGNRNCGYSNIDIGTNSILQVICCSNLNFLSALTVIPITFQIFPLINTLNNFICPYNS